MSEEAVLSDPADKVEADLDTLVARASTPSLATLFKKAKEKGLITAITHYGTHRQAQAPPENPNAQQGAPQQPIGIGGGAAFGQTMTASQHTNLPN